MLRLWKLRVFRVLNENGIVRHGPRYWGLKLNSKERNALVRWNAVWLMWMEGKGKEESRGGEVNHCIDEALFGEGRGSGEWKGSIKESKWGMEEGREETGRSFGGEETEGGKGRR